VVQRDQESQKENHNKYRCTERTFSVDLSMGIRYYTIDGHKSQDLPYLTQGTGCSVNSPQQLQITLGIDYKLEV